MYKKFTFEELFLTKPRLMDRVGLKRAKDDKRLTNEAQACARKVYNEKFGDDGYSFKELFGIEPEQMDRFGLKRAKDDQRLTNEARAHARKVYDEKFGTKQNFH